MDRFPGWSKEEIKSLSLKELSDFYQVEDGRIKARPKAKR